MSPKKPMSENKRVKEAGRLLVITLQVVEYLAGKRAEAPITPHLSECYAAAAMSEETILVDGHSELTNRLRFLCALSDSPELEASRILVGSGENGINCRKLIDDGCLRIQELLDGVEDAAPVPRHVELGRWLTELAGCLLQPFFYGKQTHGISDAYELQLMPILLNALNCYNGELVPGLDADYQREQLKRLQVLLPDYRRLAQLEPNPWVVFLVVLEDTANDLEKRLG